MLDAASIQALMPLITQINTKNIPMYVEMFHRSKAAIGGSLNQQGQEFFTKNWPGIVLFMETPAGKAAIVNFMNDWAKSLIPTSMAAPPEPAPLPAMVEAQNLLADSSGQ